jgi:hypothetical protein
VEMFRKINYNMKECKYLGGYNFELRNTTII